MTEEDLYSIALSKMNKELLMCASLYSHCTAWYLYYTAWYCIVLLGTVLYCLVQPFWLEKKEIVQIMMKLM